MSEENFYEKIKSTLNQYHKDLGIQSLAYESPLITRAFPEGFNVSGYHKEVSDLAKHKGSFWGIDKCVRLQDIPDEEHSHMFHMGIFAKSVDLHGEFSNPFTDRRFQVFQESILEQFVAAMDKIGIAPSKLEVTYFGGCKVGGSGSGGRDRLLGKTHMFPADTFSVTLLEKHKIKNYSVHSLTNLDIHPWEGALVGPRIEVAYNGVEIATLVFDCFSIQEGKLNPINYVGGYAIGIERLATVVGGGEKMYNVIPRWKKAQAALAKRVPAAVSSLLQKEMLTVLFGAEALASITRNEDFSKGQKELLRKLLKRINSACAVLGLDKKGFESLVEKYQQ